MLADETLRGVIVRLWAKCKPAKVEKHTVATLTLGNALRRLTAGTNGSGMATAGQVGAAVA